jgi:hypothetical protein
MFCIELFFNKNIVKHTCVTVEQCLVRCKLRVSAKKGHHKALNKIMYRKYILFFFIKYDMDLTSMNPSIVIQL